MSRPKSFIRIGPCKIAATANVFNGAIVGKRFRKLLDGSHENGKRRTILKKRVYIGYYSIIGSGSVIGPDAIIDDFSIVESDVNIGRRTLLIYRAHVCNEATIGSGCVIGGFVGERTTIGDKCRMFGKIVHLQHNPHSDWDCDDSMEEAPTIKESAFIGFDAIVAGGVTIGYKAYVCAHAMITQDIPDYHIAWGVNKITHFSKWKGKLSKSRFFMDA